MFFIDFGGGLLYICKLENLEIPSMLKFPCV